jgi:hypothetical protein
VNDNTVAPFERNSLPCSFKAERRYGPSRKLAFGRRQTLARFGISKRQRKIMQTWIVTNHQGGFDSFWDASGIVGMELSPHMELESDVMASAVPGNEDPLPVASREVELRRLRPRTRFRSWVTFKI